MSILSIDGNKTSLYQWDLNQRVIVTQNNNDPCTHVHFNNGNCDDVLSSVVYTEGDLEYANIPNKLLQEPYSITAYPWYATNSEHTIEKDIIKVIKRPKPVDYIYTETEVITWDNIVEAKESAQASAEAAETAQEAVEEAKVAAETAQVKAETAEYNAETAQAATEAAKTSVEATAAAFDSNAAAKTTAFDSNAATKTGNFNTNATAKSTAFNENATTKQATFDDNATAKTTAFNNNAATANATIDGKVAEVTADAATVAADKETVAADKAATLAAKAAAETAETNAETAQTAAETAEDNAAASATAAAASAESADYLPNTANALKRAISGTVVRMDDVSPLNHNLSFKQYGQCVQNGTPTPSVPIEITGKAAGANASGKNLCNPSNSYFDLSNMNVGDVITCSNSEINSNGGIQVKICSSSGGSSVWAGVISANTIGYKTKTLTATDISAGKLWLIRIYSDYQTLSSAEIIEYKIQLELGSTATEYEPYQAPITQIVTDSNGDPVTLYGIPVSSGGNVTIDGQQYVADTVEGTTLTRRVGVKVFDGTETFYKTYGDQTSYLYHFNLVHNILYSGKCTHFTPLPFARQEGTYSLTSSNEVVYINLTGLITTNDVLSTKAWFAAQYAANTPVILYYALTTPTTETVTLAPAAISANSPTTTVTAEAYTDTTYNRDAIKVIDELTAAIVALGGNI